ncbi:NAD(P)H-hydrate dehydratase [Virgibacillus ainsalahensis]
MYIVTAKEMYDIDHYTMQEIGLDGKILMENAGRSICQKVEAIIGEKRTITILVGSGNNGGDGFVIARTLINKVYEIHVVQVVPDKKITGDALYHKNLFLQCGGSVTVVQEGNVFSKRLVESEVIIDAMVGIGINGKLREPFAEIVSLINESPAYVISVDIPSGLPADEGIMDFQAVQADDTYVIGAPKMSAFLQHTARYYGRWEQVDIGFPDAAFLQYVNRQVWNAAEYLRTMPKRSPYTHKGKHGKGLVIGGSTQMPGSIAMTVNAALKAGAGLITAGTSEKVIQMIASRCVEATYLSLSETKGYLNADNLIATDKYNAIALGVGMGQSEETTKLVERVCSEMDGPVVIDADGLSHIKSNLPEMKGRQQPAILTPHPGEMAMLMDISIPEVLSKPFYYSAGFAEKYNVYVVLKGTYTVITAPDGRQAVNTTGNPGLAKGGSGDVLTGIILAMVMQDQSIFQALCNACFVHGRSADLMVEDSNAYPDLMASDVIEGISKVYRTFS